MTKKLKKFKTKKPNIQRILKDILERDNKDNIFKGSKRKKSTSQFSGFVILFIIHWSTTKDIKIQKYHLNLQHLYCEIFISVKEETIKM